MFKTCVLERELLVGEGDRCLRLLASEPLKEVLFPNLIKPVADIG